MGIKSNKQPTCKHCGGIMAFTGESFNCLMCGRDMQHMCEFCTAMPRLKRSRTSKATAG